MFLDKFSREHRFLCYYLAAWYSIFTTTIRLQVQVDGKHVQLPWHRVDSLDGTVIVQVRRDDSSTVLSTYDGIELQCDNYYHVCALTLPGRYHGQSGGLFGSNDNEPSNDADLFDENNTDVVRMAAQWSVGNKAQCTVNEADMSRVDSSTNECQTMFQSSASPIRSCFSQVMN
jgi:hypothetical protein